MRGRDYLDRGEQPTRRRIKTRQDSNGIRLVTSSLIRLSGGYRGLVLYGIPFCGWISSLSKGCNHPPSGCDPLRDAKNRCIANNLATISC